MSEIMDDNLAAAAAAASAIARRGVLQRAYKAYQARLATRRANRARTAKRRETVAELAELFSRSGSDLTTNALRAWLEANYRGKNEKPNRRSYLPAIRAAIMKSNSNAFADYIADVAARKAAGREKAIAAIKARAAARDKETPWFWNYSRVKADPKNKAYRDALRNEMIQFARQWRVAGYKDPIHGLFRIMAGL